MHKSFLLITLAVLIVGGGMSGRAEEKNGIQLNVSKTTLDRADQRQGYYYSSRIDRVEGLKVSIKNGTFKPLPAGEVRWQILVRKYYSTTVETTSGVEKLESLLPAQMKDFVIGGAQVQGWKDSASQVKDKIEWQVIVFGEGKELIRTTSTSGFEALAKRAVKQ